jgi:hypothetical protein
MQDISQLVNYHYLELIHKIEQLKQLRVELDITVN